VIVKPRLLRAKVDMEEVISMCSTPVSLTMRKRRRIRKSETLEIP
jgi:hypothetical protein